MQRTAEECYVSTDRLAAGKAADGLVYNRLENRGCKVLTGRAVIDQRLDIGLCEYAAAGSDRVDRLIILCIFIQTGGIRL